jgi:release factor glutamine methyltransferase
VNDPLREAAERLRAAGFESPRAEARILSEHARDLAPAVFEEFVQRRLRREPIAYITGHKEFWSLEFAVGPGTLIPRPETETLIEQAVHELPDRNADYRILDLGTGSACLLVALLNEFHAATGVGVDSCELALAWAWRNVKRHGLEGRCELILGNWDAAIGAFDLIVCNPPYIATPQLATLMPDVRDYEPLAALDGGPDGLDAYRSLGSFLLRHLSPMGVALLETGVGQRHLVASIMEAQELYVARAAQDLAGIARCLVIRSK